MEGIIGTYVSCQLTIWLMVPQLGVELPHTGLFLCKVLKVDVKTVDTGLAPEILVDCKESTGWLKGNHPEIFWDRYEEGRCYE